MVSRSGTSLSFPAHEKLKSRQVIAELFQQGKRLHEGTLKLIYYTYAPEGAESPNIQAAFAVSKRNFPRAVDRNRIKRLMREAYRHHKAQLFSPKGNKPRQCAVMFLYAGNKATTFNNMSEKFGVLLKRLNQELDSGASTT
ncbi:MAG TPA: ribonuclease P protein component [Bacteroidetes bacterium]|jgi:ribonuclease P protein component|nr:ribonuclease P protein component [Bacteroidota bacterium]